MMKEVDKIWKVIYDFTISYPLVVGLILFVIFSIINSIRIRRKNNRTLIDIEKSKQRYREERGELEVRENDNRLMFTHNDAIMKIFRSVLVCGGAGSGKTYTFIKPMISELIVHYPCIIYDYKNPELIEHFNLYKPSVTDADGNTMVKIFSYTIDFKNPQQSDKVNPIAPKYIPTESHAREYSNVLYKNLKGKAAKGGDPFWDDSAIALLTGCMWYLRTEEPENCNIPKLVELILQPITQTLETIRKNKSSSMICSSLFSALDNKEFKLLTNVGATLQMQMSILVNETVNQIFSADNTPLAVNNPQDPAQLLIGADEELSTTYAPLISLIMAVAIKQMNKANMRESYILIDEAPTLYIPKLEELPAVARSREISLIYCCQDISQIDSAYGKENREVLLSNLGNQFFGRSTNQTTVRYIKDLAGQEEREIENYSEGLSENVNDNGGSSGTSQNTSRSKQMRNIYESSDITNLSQGEFIYIVSDNKYGRPLLGKRKINISQYQP